jgi:diguanylate cyclase (GGDEF)-like protein
VPEQWESVERARAQRRLTINGPLNLIQGGQGLIGRVPIFSRLTNNEYWGSSSVVINLQALYEYSGLIEFAKQANIALRKQVSVDGDGQIFYGDESTFSDAFLSDVVTLPEGYWAIAISLKDDDNASFFAAHIVRSVGYVVVIILWFCFYLTYKAYQLARASSLRDELTTLPNRRYVMELLKRLASSERVTSSKFSVLNIDFNKFKTINDSYGHAAGDIVLVEVAKRLTACLRSSDTVARLGGDEFLVVLPRVSEAKELAYIIEKIKDTCKQPVIYNDIELSISLSIGSAVFLKDSDDLDKLLSMADQNMYNNKYMVKG